MIQQTAIIGMGALGLLYGSHIVKQLGRDAVSFVLDKDRFERYRGRDFFCNGQKQAFKLVESTKMQPVDLVIVAVKYNALESALETMGRCVGPDTIIISVLNGITSEKIIAQRYGAQRVLCSIALGMDAVKFGNDLQYTQMGRLCIGCFETEQEPILARLKAFFDATAITYQTPEDILHSLWGKFMLNVGVNQTCMAFEANYGQVLVPGKPRDTMLAAMGEVMALANVEGIELGQADIDMYMDILATLSPEGMPSMRQDALGRRYSEVEMFSATVIALAKGHGIATPTNQFLYDRIKAMEQAY